MFAGKCHSLLWTCFIAVTCAQLPTPVEQEVITAESGTSVTLPCHSPNNRILLLEWSRPDLPKEEYVLLFRDQQFNPANQHPSFKNRVDLQDRQMKDGDVSLILKDVTINDTGTYECRVVQRTNRRKRANLDASLKDMSKITVNNKTTLLPEEDPLYYLHLQQTAGLDP
uniref:Ig-like domain-containing protein n=1 Tax=Pundamilia nyererei TaxID=303518 RepID=A0A3B4GSP4_9CICH